MDVGYPESNEASWSIVIYTGLFDLIVLREPEVWSEGKAQGCTIACH